MDENPLKKPFDLTAFRRPQPKGPSAEELAEALGPFAPPADYNFGDEFAPEVPRPIPRKNWRGSNASRRRSKPLILIVLGIAFAAFRMLPSIENLGHYILPLWYLHWVGGLLLVSGIGQLIRNQFAVDDFQYIRDGIPIVGRVIHLQRGEIPQFAEGLMVGTICTIQALIEYTNPQRQEREFVYVQTESFPLPKADRYESGLEVGDTVTLVGLPGDFATNLRLYAWTGLSPEQDWPKLDGKPLRGMTPLKALLIAKSVLLGLWLLVGLLHVFLNGPEDGPWLWPITILISGVVLGVVFFVWLFHVKKWASPIPGAAPANLIRSIFTGMVVGMMLGTFAVFLLNSLFDRSPPVLRSVEITQHWQTTHNFIIRTYSVELRPIGGGPTVKRGIAYTELEHLQYARSRYGVELVKPGWLGLEWVAGIRPVQWHQASVPPREAEQDQIIQFASAHDGNVYAMIPYLRIDEKSVERLPPDILPLAIQEVVRENQMQVVK